MEGWTVSSLPFTHLIAQEFFPMPLSPDELKRSHEEFLEEVKAMPRGGDLEALIEKQIAQTTQGLYEAALAARDEAPATSENSEDPPPCDLS